MSLPPHLDFTVSEHVPVPKGRHRGVTVARNHHGVLVSVPGQEAGGLGEAGTDSCGKPVLIPVPTGMLFSEPRPGVSLVPTPGLISALTLAPVSVSGEG